MVISVSVSLGAFSGAIIEFIGGKFVGVYIGIGAAVGLVTGQILRMLYIRSANQSVRGTIR